MSKRYVQKNIVEALNRYEKHSVAGRRKIKPFLLENGSEKKTALPRCKNPQLTSLPLYNLWGLELIYWVSSDVPMDRWIFGFLDPPLDRWFTGSMVRRFAGSMDRWFDGSLVRWFVGSMDRWFNGSLVRLFAGSMDRWFAGSMDRWFNGSLVRWIVGSLVRWIVGSMVPWFDGSLDLWIVGSMDVKDPLPT